MDEQSNEPLLPGREAIQSPNCRLVPTFSNEPKKVELRPVGSSIQPLAGSPSRGFLLWGDPLWEPGALTSRDGGATSVLPGLSKAGGPTALDCIQADKTDGRGDGELYEVELRLNVHHVRSRPMLARCHNGIVADALEKIVDRLGGLPYPHALSGTL